MRFHYCALTRETCILLLEIFEGEFGRPFELSPNFVQRTSYRKADVKSAKNMSNSASPKKHIE